MGTENFEEEKMRVVLTKPMSLEEDSNNDNKASNILKGILSILKDIRPGSDLTKLQLPPQFNFPKSHLQVYGESVYSVAQNMLEKCNSGRSPIERFIAVIAFSMSNMRLWTIGAGPYNPILGETHHVSNGSLNVLLEQISHHPPVTALHATDEKENVDLLWCQQAAPKFYGTSVVLQLNGKRQLKLQKYGETYAMNSPNVLFQFIPMAKVEWIGNQRIECRETCIEAELSFGGRSFLGIGGSRRLVKGKIFDSTSRRLLYEITGHWDKTLTLRDITSNEIKVVYDAKEVTSGLKTPIVKDLKGVRQSESAVVWSEVSKGIMSRDWEKATEAKKSIEETHRKLSRERESRGETWNAKHFNVFYSKKAGWDCSPIEKLVPPAPIIVPFNM